MAERPTLWQQTSRDLAAERRENERLRLEIVALWSDASARKTYLREHLGMTFAEYKQWSEAVARDHD